MMEEGEMWFKLQTLEIECNNKDSITTRLSFCSCTKYKYPYKNIKYYYKDGNFLFVCFRDVRSIIV